MGIPSPLLNWILQDYRRHGLPRRVLTLGRQHIVVTPAQAVDLIQKAGLPLFHTPGEVIEVAELPSLGSLRGDISDRAFFRLLGIEIQSMDASDFERPDLIHDLNEPVPKEWHGQFDQILDGGTVEHVFDVRQCLRNIFDLLAVDGEIVHMSPCNNHVNHGFYQFSPTLFFDFYAGNQFDSIQGYLAKALYDEGPTPMKSYELKPENLREICSWHKLLLLFRARKRAQSTGHVAPQQGKWSHLYSPEQKRSRPFRVPKSLRGLASRVRYGLYRWFPQLHPSRREPWGHHSEQPL